MELPHFSFTLSHAYLLRNLVTLIMKRFCFEAFNFEEELPEYDLDTEDEDWLNNFNKKKVRQMAVLIFSG